MSVAKWTKTQYEYSLSTNIGFYKLYKNRLLYETYYGLIKIGEWDDLKTAKRAVLKLYLNFKGSDNLSLPLFI